MTSDLVLAELWNLVNARIDHRMADRIIGEIARGGIVRVQCATGIDFAAATAAQKAFPDEAFSLTDCTSWALMARLAITEALALGNHFRIYRYISPTSHSKWPHRWP